MIINCKRKKQFRKVLSFLKEKGLTWESDEDLENYKLSDEYWEYYKSKIYLIESRENRNKICYGCVTELGDRETDKELIEELKRNEKITLNKSNLNKLYLISRLSK